jgi:hypothetical protein
LAEEKGETAIVGRRREGGKGLSFWTTLRYTPFQGRGCGRVLEEELATCRRELPFLVKKAEAVEPVYDLYVGLNRPRQ